MRGPQLPKEYVRDMKRAARGFKGAATLARRVGYDATALRELRKVAAENNAENFASDGAAMGAKWTGQKAGAVTLNNAVETGALKMHSTTPWLLKPRVTAKAIRFNVPKRRLPYIKNVGALIMGWTPRGTRAMAETVLAEMVKIANRERNP